jgi:hypothetical protein
VLVKSGTVIVIVGISCTVGRVIEALAPWVMTCNSSLLVNGS